MKTDFVCILLVAASFFVSCQKEGSPTTVTMDLLTSSPWVTLKAEERVNNSPWLDVYTFWASCEKDNTWIFKTDMSLEYNESLLACSPSSPNATLDVVTWAFANNESQIVVEDDLVYTIEQLDTNTLIISITETVGGDTYSNRLTFRH